MDGNVDDWDAEQLSMAKRDIGQALQLDPSQIGVSVLPGSVVLKVVLPEKSQADRLVELVSGMSRTATTAPSSARLMKLGGVRIESASTSIDSAFVEESCYTREAWTSEKRAWCCKHHKLGCEDLFVKESCYTKEAWTQEKKAWCCKHHEIGCLLTTAEPTEPPTTQLPTDMPTNPPTTPPSTDTPTPFPTRRPTHTPTKKLSKTCVLTGGEVVPRGWRGRDTGSNECNTCRCRSKGRLFCTQMHCPTKMSLEVSGRPDDITESVRLELRTSIGQSLGIDADELIVEVSESVARRTQRSVKLDVTVVPDVEHQQVTTLVSNLNSGTLRPLVEHHVFSATTTRSEQPRLDALSSASLSETRARSEAGHSTAPAAEAESGAGGMIALVAGVIAVGVAVVAVVALAIRRRKARAREAEGEAALRRLVVMDGSGAGPILCDLVGGTTRVQMQGGSMPMPSGMSARPGRRQRGGSKLMDTLTTFHQMNTSTDRTDFTEVDLTDSQISVCLAV